jgi:hypothetical protein
MIRYEDASGEKALPLVAQLGSEKSAATDDRGSRMLKPRFENMITFLRAPLYQRDQRID